MLATLFSISIVIFFAWIVNILNWLQEMKMTRMIDSSQGALGYQETPKAKEIDDSNDKTVPIKSPDSEKDGANQEAAQAEPIFQIRDIKVFGLLYWLVLLNGVLSTVIYYNFSNFTTDLLTQRYRYAFSDANN